MTKDRFLYCYSVSFHCRALPSEISISRTPRRAQTILLKGRELSLTAIALHGGPARCQAVRACHCPGLFRAMRAPSVCERDSGLSIQDWPWKKDSRMFFFLATLRSSDDHQFRLTKALTRGCSARARSFPFWRLEREYATCSGSQTSTSLITESI